MSTHAENDSAGRGQAEPLAVVLPGEVVEAVARRVAQLVTPAERSDREPWIDVQQAADHLACKPHRIYDLVRQRKVHFRKDGARLLFRRSDLDRYVSGGSSDQDEDPMRWSGEHTYEYLRAQESGP